MPNDTLILKPGCIEGLNQQIVNEMHASLQYLAIASYFDDEGLPELAGHFSRQSEEERQHALKFVKYLHDAGTRPVFKGIPDVRNDFSSATDAVQCALDGEIKVTNQINDLVGLSHRENDYMTHTFLQWFVTEQLEEVSTVTTLLQVIKHAGPSLLLVEDFIRRMPTETEGADA
ncbi:MAG: ferritin [Candidatus Eremiobacteraeota bacterium]|nr:ferritin [Candidatus Eremiobacteraeota bacterium]MCW5866703.1 ferritin [Candidatus Eremiobacteraeota bacterium]